MKDELEEIELTQTALAHHIGVLPRIINEICRGKRGISPFVCAGGLVTTFAGFSAFKTAGIDVVTSTEEITE